MLKEVHEHVVSELQQSARTDTVFVVSAVLFNLVVLGINWGVAAGSRKPNSPAGNDWILALLIVATLLINSFAVRALSSGRQTRSLLLSGLITMYEDNGVAKYYDPGLLDTFATRYKLFIAVLISLVAVTIFVPLLVRFIG
jgi:hypothetical protein